MKWSVYESAKQETRTVEDNRRMGLRESVKAGIRKGLTTDKKMPKGEGRARCARY
jgi:hypothetical protein